MDGCFNDTKTITTIMPKCKMASGYCTFDVLFKVFAWSMACLKEGAAPSRRHDGSVWTAADTRTRMAGGSVIPRAALLMVRGDWEWLCQCFPFRHFGNESFCYLCEATHTGANSFLNSSPHAPYRQTIITHERL